MKQIINNFFKIKPEIEEILSEDDKIIRSVDSILHYCNIYEEDGTLNNIVKLPTPSEDKIINLNNSIKYSIYENFENGTSYIEIERKDIDEYIISIYPEYKSIIREIK